MYPTWPSKELCASHVGTKSINPFITPSSEPQWGFTMIERFVPNFPDRTEEAGSDGRNLSIPSISRTPAARRGAPSINLLASKDACLASTPSRQTPSPRNSWRTGQTKLGAEHPPGSPIMELSDLSQHPKDTVYLTLTGQKSLMPPSRAWCQENLRVWILPRPVGSQILVLRFPHFLHAPTQNSKDRGRSLIVAIPKTENPLGNPKRYRSISFLCVVFKIFERLIYARVEPVIDPLLPQE